MCVCVGMWLCVCVRVPTCRCLREHYPLVQVLGARVEAWAFRWVLCFVVGRVCSMRIVAISSLARDRIAHVASTSSTHDLPVHGGMRSGGLVAKWWGEHV